MNESTTIVDKDGNIMHARGIDVCENPIGEDIFVQTYLVSKIESIRTWCTAA